MSILGYIASDDRITVKWWIGKDYLSGGAEEDHLGIETKHFPNTSLEHYCYMNPLTGPDEGHKHFRISYLDGLQM